ncbi:MAG: phage tail sheath subtilisin-like domain-containing protein [Pseudomonadota bacterium]
MPEYLAPGVFVEEVSFRQKTIEGVSTSTTGFVGPTRFGPTEGEPPLLTSFSDFERIYGGLDPLTFDGDDSTNFLAHAVRSYFDEGGKRLYVSRIYNAGEDAEDDEGTSFWPPEGTAPDPGFAFRARHPGVAGDIRLQMIFRLSGNTLVTIDGTPQLRGVQNFDTVLATPAAPADSDPEVYWVERFTDEDLGRESFRLRQDDGGAAGTTVALDEVLNVHVLTVNLLILPPGRFADEIGLEGISFHHAHPSSLATVLAAEPERRSTLLFTPLVMTTPATNGSELGTSMLGLMNNDPITANQATILSVLQAVVDGGDLPTDEQVMATVMLAGGSDGEALTIAQYDGEANEPKSGLAVLEDLEDISIVAAPGSTADTDLGPAVSRALIIHAERMRYRIAVLDSAPGQLPAEIRAQRAEIDSTRAALYYPWVNIADPLAQGPGQELSLPPSGFVTGIYARTDNDRGVHKAPANEVVRSALGFEFLINRRQQEALNPEGINCLRFFEGRGFRVWGGRTVSSDPEWRYVNVRRYFLFLEQSIDKGTQWTVFEPNGPRLWANLQRTVEDFLYNEFVSGHLAGRRPEDAYFVRCDETTMTQNDRDNGRLICLIGVAPLRPAEFVIFRIGQKTVDARG